MTDQEFFARLSGSDKERLMDGLPLSAAGEAERQAFLLGFIRGEHIMLNPIRLMDGGELYHRAPGWYLIPHSTLTLKPGETLTVDGGPVGLRFTFPTDRTLHAGCSNLIGFDPEVILRGALSPA